MRATRSQIAKQSAPTANVVQPPATTNKKRKLDQIVVAAADPVKKDVKKR